MGIMEKKMETTIVYWGYIRIMGKKMEITIVYGGFGHGVALQPSHHAWCKFDRWSLTCLKSLSQNFSVILSYIFMPLTLGVAAKSYACP